MKLTACWGLLPFFLLAMLAGRASAGGSGQRAPLSCCCRCPCETCPSYGGLKDEALRLSGRFMPYERLLDRLIERAGFDHPVPTDLVRRLVSLDEEIQHVNAEVLLKVERRCKIQSEIAQIRADLCKLHADWRILTQTWSPSGH